MLRVLVAVNLALTLLPVAVAKGPANPAVGSFDAMGDGDPDLLSVGWWIDEATGELVLQAALAHPREPGQELRWLWVRGEPGQADPAESYWVHLGNQPEALTGHGEPGRPVNANATQDGAVITVRIVRIEASSAACTVVAAQAGLGSTAGFTLTDEAPNGGIAATTQALQGTTCPASETLLARTTARQDTPAFAPILLVGLVAGLAWLRRRSDT